LFKGQILNIKIFLKKILEESDSKLGHYFSFFIQSLIVLSIITFSIETLPDLSKKAREILNLLEAIMVGIFTVEYLLRVYVADKKTKYIFSFYGIIDFLAILPFYLSTGLDLRAIRIFRLLRLVQILKLFRYNQAIRRFKIAFTIAKEELILFSFVALILLYLSAVGIYYFENEAQPDQFKSVFHSLWWAVTTLTTVGYGDMYPITVGGRLFTFFVLMLGLGIVAIPTGLLSSALTQARTEEKNLSSTPESTDKQ
jgi:voltage-gated potassium channel